MHDHHDLVAPLVERGMALPQAAADLNDDAFAPVLQALLAAEQGNECEPRLELATAAGAEPTQPSPHVPAALRRRLVDRVLRSAAASRALHTRRHADTVPMTAAPGVTLRSLYEATPGTARRPGEPEAVTLIELAPGAVWPAAAPAAATPAATAPGLQREWLVLRGSVQVGGITLAAHDYHVVPAGVPSGSWASRDGALVYQRQARPAPGAPAAAITQHAAAAVWDHYAPGILRRVLWQQRGQAAMLYHALPGAMVPHHGHRHDEECLMLAGDFFLDDVLLRALDYQVAPAGTEHELAHTDTGVVIYAHGDIDLDLR
jgi:quercetin dioxygenase-like cupin family protein